jgi:predicted HD superfamily hydrolase involved in NAD metabolism
VDYDTAAHGLRTRLGATAVAHCERVASTAGALARAYDVDVDSARLAGLLHDWDRELGDEALLNASRLHGIELTPTDRAVPYLLHARTGALGVASAFPGISAEVVHAIEAHTVGAGEMSPLDKVVYVADMLEPDRDFPGVTELRESVGESTLDELYLSCYQRSLIHLVERKRPLHPQTVNAWNALVSGSAR